MLGAICARENAPISMATEQWTSQHDFEETRRDLQKTLTTSPEVARFSRIRVVPSEGKLISKGQWEELETETDSRRRGRRQNK